MYIERHIEKHIKSMAETFPSILVTGPRQVGKSTTIRHCFSDISYMLLDNSAILTAFRQDMPGFLALHGTPLILDEIQRIPEAFMDIKYRIDMDKHAGMYILTGSQRYELMQGVSESLAGRIKIINMLGLSKREIDGESFSDEFIPSDEYFAKRNAVSRVDSAELWRRIHKGSLPELYENEHIGHEDYYSSYVNSYVERDVRQLLQVENLLDFVRFMTALAARTGELLNMEAIARDVGISPVTVKKWLSVLQASGIVYLLRPFSMNVSKRIVKTPKVYFMDTGLVSYLCGWPDAVTLERGAMSGQVYETYVVSEIVKSYFNAGREPDLYFFRNTDGQEVDLLVRRGDTLYPIEVKKTASPNAKDAKHFKTLKTYFPELNIAEGCVLCNAEMPLPLGDKLRAVPVDYI